MGQRRGFTLVELLVTISVIAIMATFVLFASFGALESAKEATTKATIAKLHNIVMNKFEGYRTRRVAVPPMPSNTPFNQVAKVRLDCLRELMRMELPERWTDVVDGPLSGIARPAVSQAYLRRFKQVAPANPTPAQQQQIELYQGAECLYMIVTLGITDELGGREHFNESYIGDADGDGFPEFWDAWKNPIRFLRWAPGFPSELQQGGVTGYVTSGQSATSFVGNPELSPVDNAYVGRAVMFTKDPSLKGKAAQVIGYSGSTKTFTLFADQLPGSPGNNAEFIILPEDPFDPRHVYPAAQPKPQNSPQCPTFALYPLIYSAGPDEIFDIVSDTDSTLHHAPPPPATVNLANNPFVGYGDTSVFTSGQIGSIADLSSTSRTGIKSDANGVNNAADNIHNHLLETRVNR